MVVGMLQKIKISYKFIIVGKKTSLFKLRNIFSTTISGIELRRNRIEQNGLKDLYSQTQTILDLVRDNQSGLSFRVFEAMAFQKKLITNNTNILDYNFTAKVEQDFDEIAEGNVNWTKMMQEFYDKFHPSVKQVEEHAERESGERILGIHPESGKPISVRLGKFGPMAQIGAADDEDKKFASLMADQNIGNITLEEALKLFLLPKNLGVYKGEEIEINNGRYGPYIKFGAAFISLPKGENPTDITLERAQELIDETFMWTTTQEYQDLKNNINTRLFNEKNKLCAWENVETGEKKGDWKDDNLTRAAFSGIHILSPKCIDLFPQKEAFSIIDFYLEAAKNHFICGYFHDESIWLDVGKVESLATAEKLKL